MTSADLSTNPTPEHNTPNSGAMPLQFVEQRRGRPGHPVGAERIARMIAIIAIIAEKTIAITARHLFYLLVMRGTIPKTVKAYEQVLDDLLMLRRSGDVAWSAIADGTRLKTRWVGYGTLASALETWQETYRRDIWRTAPARCEVWSESRGLLSTINEIAGEYGVTTLGVGGFNSATIGWETAQEIKAAIRNGQQFYIFHCGDHDPSGHLIGASAEREIRAHLDDDEQDQFCFRRVALTAEQVREYKLPSAPPKRNADGSIRGRHAKSWDGGTTELDALDPLVLQRLVREAIESIIDARHLRAVQLAEDSEKQILRRLMASVGGAS